VSLPQNLLHKVLCEVIECWVEGEMMKVTMFISSVVVEVDEVLNIVMGTNMFNVLLTT
jgi:hypothetical protein